MRSRLSATPLRLKVDSASVNQEQLSQVQKVGSFTLVGAACWLAAGAHPGGSGRISCRPCHELGKVVVSLHHELFVINKSFQLNSLRVHA